MSQPLISPEISEDNKLTIHSFLHQSYDHAKKQIGNGVTRLQDGVSFIKDELTTLYDKTGDYLHNMMLPVNNFLKDLSQIDNDFQQEEFKLSEQASTGCTIIPIEVAILSGGEENY